MKKIYLFLIAMMSVLGASAQQTWDFTATSDADVAALKAATSDWTYTESSNRFENVKAISGKLMAGNTEIQLTKGLTFTAAEKKLRIDVNNRVQLAGKNVSVTILNLKKGQTVTVSCASTGNNATTLDNQVNLTNVSGFTAADKNTTQEGKGTVAADGDVTLSSSTGSMNIYSIIVEGEGGGNEGGTQDEINNNVPMDLTQNQVRFTLTSNDVKYYNTTNVSSIDIDDTTNKILVNTYNGGTDTYNGTVSNISFRKKEGNQGGDISNNGVEIIDAKGWLESAYVTWKPYTNATTYRVYIKGGQYSNWTKLDYQLVRNYGTYGRADAVGLQAGNYDFKVVPVVSGSELTDKASEASNLNVKNYQREGFAHKNYSGIGAYNDDGTLKSGAVVVYLTKDNAKTVSATLNSGTFTGIQAILKAYEKGNVTTPLDIRVIGTINADDVDYFESSSEGLQIKGKNGYSPVNITLEGIGEDATFYGFGFLIRNCTSVEMRNFADMRCMDDGISLDTNNSNVWIHHVDIFYGQNKGGDKKKGDGALDLKVDSKYITIDNVHFWDTGKSSLCGMKSESGPNWITYHHNWFDHGDSRHPRVRTMSVHVWNNYYDGVSKMGACAVKGANLFVENNYFRNSKKPMLIAEQGSDGLNGSFDDHDGGMLKAYGNVLTGASLTSFIPHTKNATSFDAYVAETRNEKVPDTYKSVVGNYTYNNFDTDSSIMYTYTPDDANEVPAVVTGYYGAGRMNHGDFQYTFSSSDDTNYDLHSALENLLNSYTSNLVSVFPE